MLTALYCALTSGFGAYRAARMFESRTANTRAGHVLDSAGRPAYLQFYIPSETERWLTGPLRVTTRGIFSTPVRRNRTAFLIDGLNLHHSVMAAHKALDGQSTRWLNVGALCSEYLYAIDRRAILTGIHYFSAVPGHLESVAPGISMQSRAYLDCLTATGVQVELSRFKKTRISCSDCGTILTRYEEKETDVALATKLHELLHLEQCETVVLVTGDTDLAPAVRTAQRLFPKVSLLFAFPFERKNKELHALAPRSFQISKENIAKHQLPDPFVLPSGRIMHKPGSW